MTINYCSWSTGSDETGDGSRTNPYKSIDKATTGLTGGDECRCAKSSANTTLAGTTTWTNGSATINTTNDLTTVVFAKDLVQKNTLHANDENVFWEVSSVTATTIVLVDTFVGETQSGITSVKVGVTDTGTAPTSTSIIQQAMSSGSSTTSVLNITGGWDLSLDPPVQNGQTTFWQSGTNRQGYAYVADAKNYINVENIHTARYNIGFYVLSGTVWHRFYECGSHRNNQQINIAVTHGVYIENFYGVNGTITFAQLAVGLNIINYRSPRTGTPSVISSTQIYFEDCRISNPTTIQIYAYAKNLLAVDCDFTNCAWQLFRDSVNQKLYNCILTGGVVESHTFPKDTYGNHQPQLICKLYNRTSNDDRFYMINGYVKKNTSDARGSACMEFIPNDTTYYLRYPLWGIPAIASTTRTITFWIKKSATFNGDADAALYYNGNLVDGWDAMNVTTGYVQKTLVCPGGSVVENGVVELHIRVRGTVGSVYVDEIMVT